MDEIKSVEDAIHMMRELEGDEFSYSAWPLQVFPFGIWFRGHANKEWKLSPRVFRPADPDDMLRRTEKAPGKRRKAKPEYHDEDNLFDYAKLRVRDKQRASWSTFDWLCLLQHYGVPTRLLDWSESILPAIYFALKSPPPEKPDTDGELIVLNARRLNESLNGRQSIWTVDSAIVTILSEMARTRSKGRFLNLRSVTDAKLRLEEDAETRFKVNGYSSRDDEVKGAFLEGFCKKPVAVLPTRFNDRMIFQGSVFTLHGGKIYVDGMKQQYEKDTLPAPTDLEDIRQDPPILRRYKIPRKAKAQLREELFRLGIHEGTLFPELDRQATYLKQLW